MGKKELRVGKGRRGETNSQMPECDQTSGAEINAGGGRKESAGYVSRTGLFSSEFFLLAASLLS